MAGRYNPAKKLVERFPRFSRKKIWHSVAGFPSLMCGCGESAFYVRKTGMQRQRHTMKASHRKIVAVCLNPKCGQEHRLD
jgi:hypothetical protein